VSTTRVGLGFDVHPFSEDPARPLILGGVVLDGPGLHGHSDADLVAHAVCDAILGVTGHEDLGTLFPASDPQWHDAASMRFVEEAARLVAVAGWWIINVDVVVAAEAPKLGPHVATIASNVASALAVARRPMGEGVHVSVKPKRGEGLGFVGRVEGMAAWAVALLERG